MLQIFQSSIPGIDRSLTLTPSCILNFQTPFLTFLTSLVCCKSDWEIPGSFSTPLFIRQVRVLWERVRVKFSQCRSKGPVNIYGNMGPGNLQWDHWSFLLIGHVGTPLILNVEYMGLPLISMSDIKDYFEVLKYGAMEYHWSFCYNLIVNMRCDGKYLIRDQRLFRLDISAGQ